MTKNCWRPPALIWRQLRRSAPFWPRAKMPRPRRPIDTRNGPPSATRRTPTLRAYRHASDQPIDEDHLPEAEVQTD